MQAIGAEDRFLKTGLAIQLRGQHRGIMILSHDLPQTRGGTRRRTRKTTLRSYDGSARGGLQYPRYLGAWQIR